VLLAWTSPASHLGVLLSFLCQVLIHIGLDVLASQLLQQSRSELCALSEALALSADCTSFSLLLLLVVLLSFLCQKRNLIGLD
jgi:hypothetical protein